MISEQIMAKLQQNDTYRISSVKKPLNYEIGITSMSEVSLQENMTLYNIFRM